MLQSPTSCKWRKCYLMSLVSLRLWWNSLRLLVSRNLFNLIKAGIPCQEPFSKLVMQDLNITNSVQVICLSPWKAGAIRKVSSNTDKRWPTVMIQKEAGMMGYAAYVCSKRVCSRVTWFQSFWACLWPDYVNLTPFPYLALMTVLMKFIKQNMWPN